MNKTEIETKLVKETLTEADRINLSKFFENLNIFGNEISRKIRQDIAILEEIARYNAPVIAAIIKNIEQMPGEFLEIQKALAKRGWFVLAEMPATDYRNLKNLIDESKFGELDQTMNAWTVHLLDDTEKKLCDLFPSREIFLREGFDSHRSGKYASAITLLLTQVNGICFDSLDKIFFKERQEKGGVRVTGIKTEIEALGVDEFSKIILHPVLNVSGINANEEQIRNGEFPDSPHRNPILHGKVTDFATELNSLKIISLVGFMGGIIHQIGQKAKESATASPAVATPTGLTE